MSVYMLAIDVWMLNAHIQYFIKEYDLILHILS